MPRVLELSTLLDVALSSPEILRDNTQQIFGVILHVLITRLKLDDYLIDLSDCNPRTIDHLRESSACLKTIKFSKINCDNDHIDNRITVVRGLHITWPIKDRVNDELIMTKDNALSLNICKVLWSRVNDIQTNYKQLKNSTDGKTVAGTTGIESIPKKDFSSKKPLDRVPERSVSDLAVINILKSNLEYAVLKLDYLEKRVNKLYFDFKKMPQDLQKQSQNLALSKVKRFNLQQERPHNVYVVKMASDIEKTPKSHYSKVHAYPVVNQVINHNPKSARSPKRPISFRKCRRTPVFNPGTAIELVHRLVESKSPSICVNHLDNVNSDQNELPIIKNPAKSRRMKCYNGKSSYDNMPFRSIAKNLEREVSDLSFNNPPNIHNEQSRIKTTKNCYEIKNKS